MLIGHLMTQQVLQTALEHERKWQRSQRLQRMRSETDLLYEEIIPEQTILPGPFESISKSEKDSENLDKVGDSTMRGRNDNAKITYYGRGSV